MTEIDLDLLATVSSLAGPGASTDVAAVARALDEAPDANGEPIDDLDAALHRLAEDGLVDVADGEGDGAAVTVTPEGWAAIQPEYPT
jgi:hypothetical protein